MKLNGLICASLLLLSTLSSCKKEEGFTIRGTKGYDWTPEQCLQEIPFMKEAGMNFFAPCYLSFYDRHGDLNSMAELKGYNNWWKPFTDSQKEEWGAVVRECRRNGIEFCFGMNPMLYSDKPLDTSSEEDYKSLFEKYRWFQKNGVKWFYVALDDLHLQKNTAIESDNQFLLVNRLYEDLKKRDRRCKMVFCPTWYWGSNLDNPERRPYLERMSEILDKEILVFWTGEQVVSPKVTVADALRYKEVVGHELIFWDNYPVNDFNNTIYVGPVTGREPELKDVLYGMMSNPMRDNMMNRMPMLTVGDYMRNPKAYDPTASIESSIGKLAANDGQSQVLHSLLAYYSSNYANCKPKTSYNHARAVFLELLARDKNEAEDYMEGLSGTLRKFISAYPSGFEPSKRIIRNDVDWMCEKLGSNWVYKVGQASRSVEPGDNFFSLALLGYGHPAEGRFSLEWNHVGEVPVTEPISVSGDQDHLFALALNGDLFREDDGIWTDIGSTNPIVLLAGSDPNSFKVIASSNDSFYSVSLLNELSSSGKSAPLSWKKHGKTPDAIALTASEDLLYLATRDGELYYSGIDKKEWKPVPAPPVKTVSLAYHDGRLYALGENQQIWMKDTGEASEWMKIAWLNGLTYKHPIKFITVSGGRLYGFGYDGSLYRAHNRSENNLTVNAVAVSDSRTNVILMNLDSGAIGYDLVHRIKEEIFLQTGVEPSNILFNVTHTHFAPAAMDWIMFPGGIADKRYLDLVFRQSVDAAKEAFSSMKESEMTIFTSTASVGYNRGLKGDDAIVDSNVDMVLASPLADGGKVLLVEAACHPVFPNENLSRFTLSANYPGALRSRIDSELNVRSIFFQGCCADINPQDADYRKTADNLAATIISGVNGGNGRRIEGRIYAKLDSVIIPIKAKTRKEVLDFLHENRNRALDIEAEKNVKWAENMLSLYDSDAVPSTMTEYFQIIDIGNWRIVGLSREPVSSFALETRKMWPGKNVTVMGYCNDISSYLPDEKHIKAGTYESTDSFLWYGSPAVLPSGTAARILEAVKKSQ